MKMVLGAFFIFGISIPASAGIVKYGSDSYYWITPKGDDVRIQCFWHSDPVKVISSNVYKCGRDCFVLDDDGKATNFGGPFDCPYSSPD